MGADSCPAVCRFGACGGHVPTLCLRCTRSFLGVAWRSSCVAFLLVPLPPSAFFLIYLFIYLFILSGVGSFYFHWASGLSVTGAIVGGWARGGSWLGCGLVGLWVFFCLGVYCGCSPLAHGHPTSTCDAGVNNILRLFRH